MRVVGPEKKRTKKKKRHSNKTTGVSSVVKKIKFKEVEPLLKQGDKSLTRSPGCEEKHRDKTGHYSTDGASLLRGNISCVNRKD